MSIKTAILPILLPVVLLCSVQHGVASEPSSGAKKAELSDTMDMMLEIQASRYQSPDDRLCEKAARTKAFDLWIEDFSKGDLKLAEKHWQDVLAQLKKMGCGDCSRINSIANERTAMLDTKVTGVALWQHLLSATEHSLGPDDRYTATCLKLLAMQFEGLRKYSEAAGYRQREFAILAVKMGRSSAEAIDAKKWLDIDEAHVTTQRRKSH